ncbi:cohesin domain-containing protein [Clostridiaceae bacterium M8S5]|nr:cohesin domain-containing protein [Clostridiaceae bacterium M8S5]
MKYKRLLKLVLFVCVFTATFAVSYGVNATKWNTTEGVGSSSNDGLTLTIKGHSLNRANNFKESGKWYWEITIDNDGLALLGIGNAKAPLTLGDWATPHAIVYYGSNGRILTDTDWSYGSTFTKGDVIGVALDMDNGTLGFYKNGVYQGIASNKVKSLGNIYPAAGCGGYSSTSIMTANFGATSFKHDIPEGYKAFDDTNNLKLDIEADNYTIKGGTEFDTYVIIDGATNIFAEDFTVNYDDTLFEFVDSAVVEEDEQEIHYKEANNNDIRYIVASKGSDYALNNKKKIIKLTFRAKNVNGSAIIKVKEGLVANGQGVETTPTLLGKTFTIEKQSLGDVNLDGKYSLGDLAIASRLLATEEASWESFKPDTDLNGAVDKTDLNNIVEQIK